MEENELKELENILEAVLFALGREISINELSDNLKVEKENILLGLENLNKKYNNDSAIVLVKINDSYQLVTNKKYYEKISTFVENTKRQNLSTSAIETLTIIAYNPKITKTEIERIRGVNSDFAVSRLQECGLVEEVARLNLPGRPAAYSVTSEFLKSCNIEKIEQLPDFENIRIKDEQMLVTDYDDSQNNQNEQSENKMD